MSDQISSRLPLKFISEIESLVNEGYYLSASDFVREAVRDKLELSLVHEALIELRKEVKAEDEE